MGERGGWTLGALAGSLVAGLAISGLMIVKEMQTDKPSDLIAWGRAGAKRLGLHSPAKNAMPGAGEQSAVHAGHLALSALGGLAYAASFDEDAPVIASGFGFGMAFYVACHWVAGPLLRLKPLEWREPASVVGQHLVVHTVYGIAIAAAARAGTRWVRQKSLA